MKTAQSYRGVVIAAIAGAIMWSGFAYAWHEGYIPDSWHPGQLAVCTAGTIFMPGCWVNYAIKMWKRQ